MMSGEPHDLRSSQFPRRIGLLTGGGDAPGLNAVIRAVVRSATLCNCTCIGIEESFNGLMERGRTRELTLDDVVGLERIGGTILGTSSRGDPFAYPVEGSSDLNNFSSACLDRFGSLELEALVVVGGDGTLDIAHKFHQLGMPIVGVPKTIDNDIVGTNSTFGFDTAVSFATEAIDRLDTTAQAHSRVMVVEVIGRHAGWIALHAGVAGGADVILMPEVEFDLHRVADAVRAREQRGRRSSIVVVAEGAIPKGGSAVIQEDGTAGRLDRLGGVGAMVAAKLQDLTKKKPGPSCSVTCSAGAHRRALTGCWRRVLVERRSSLFSVGCLA